jgi:transposase
MEAMRCLKRRISDAVYKQLVADAARATPPRAAEEVEAGPGGHCGRLKNPARSTCPLPSTLRISHFPDPQPRRYAAHM